MSNEVQETNQLNELVMQDTSSNALTEVALGLSMAFFALLVLALVSMVMPKQVGKTSQINDYAVVDAKATADQDVEQTTNEALFLFYFHGQMVDENMSLREVDAIPSGQSVVLALDPSTSFEELIKVQQKLSHVDLQLTKLSDSWIRSLSNHFGRF